MDFSKKKKKMDKYCKDLIANKTKTVTCILV